MRTAVVLIAILAVIAVVAIVWWTYTAGWERAVRNARWRPNSRDVNGRTEVIIEKVAERGDRREVLATQHVEWMDHTLPATVWEIEFSVAMSRAQMRADTRNNPGL